ncbi:MAG: ABC transporter permease [Candidatus Bathyarchaeia archaeon]
MADMFTVASKEFADMVKGKRFITLIIIFGLVMTVAMATIYIQVMRMMEGIPGVAMPRGFLGLITFSLSGTMSYFAPVMGLALGCDAISGEREKGTLKIVLVQPIFRDTVINGKFIAAASAVSLAIVFSSMVSVGAAMILLGVTPTAEEGMRMALFLIFSILFTMTYYGISIFFSTILKRTSQSVILGVTTWALFTFVIPIIASLIALTMVWPIVTPGQEDSVERMRNFTAIVEGISSITPNYHFGKIAQYLLNPYATTGGYLQTQPQPQPQSIQEAAPITTSLIYAGPNILVLAIATMLAFFASYIVFTRQEVR